MNIVGKTLAPLRRAAHLFFRSQLRLKVRGGLRVALADSTLGRQPTPAALAEAKAQRDLDQILEDLSQALGDPPDTRDSLRHLSFVEEGLREEGLSALYRVPLGVLQRALEQFEGLVSNWEPRGLADLRSKMAVAVMDREANEEDDGRPATAPAARRVTAT